MIKPFKKSWGKTHYFIEEISGKGASHLLDQIPDIPKTLYICGNKDLLNDPDMKYLCVVGSRKFTDYGKEACIELIQGLSKSLHGHKVAIVSGLALGIDGIAHRAALECGLPCIAVPGSGLDEDIIYPRTHTFLAEDILKSGGVLLSEYPPSTRAASWTFPMRNRIMAGLSHAVFIIEGEKDSGTLITTKLALEYNRDVFALPGSIFSPSSEGPISLIKRGAIPIASVEDLLEALGIKNQNLFLKDSPVKDDALEIFKSLSQEERVVLEHLSINSLSRNDLFESVCKMNDSDINNRNQKYLENFDFSKFQVILSMLEIREFIVEKFGEVRLTDLAKQLLLCNTTSNEEK